MIPERRIAAVRGDTPADLLLKNGRVINVFTGEILNSEIAVLQGEILGYGGWPARREVDLKGRYVAPGFIDAHVHIESSMAAPPEFVRSVLPSGTTAVIADPHEIANVLGIDGVRYMIRSADGLPLHIFYCLPSCVPATEMETSGAQLTAGDLAKLVREDRIVALGEMMNFPGVVHGDAEVYRKIALAHASGLVVDGHCPGLSGRELAVYVSAGIGSDHECTRPEEALEKLRAGMRVMIREGTGAKNLEALLPVVDEHTIHRTMWCTDDRHPHDLISGGHIDAMVRKAIRKGLDPVRAIQMATICPADHFGLKSIGAIAPGRFADMVVFSDLKALRIEQVFHKGTLVAENGMMREIPAFPDALPLASTMKINLSRVDFRVPAAGERLRVIGLVPGQIMTKSLMAPVCRKDGFAVSDLERDILKIAVVDRHSGTGRTGVGFVTGFGLKQGALASSVAHDSHNIITVGVNDDAMKAAVRAVVEMGGGLAVSGGDRLLETLPLPIAGLMSPDPVVRIAAGLDRLKKAAEGLGAVVPDPFMALSFLALPVIPELKLTDRGLVDVQSFQVVSLFV